jgi:hypothetical protein
MSNEPVAWVKTENFVDDDGLWSGRIVFNQHGDGMPLYTRPVDDTALLRQALSTLDGWANYGKWVWPESALEQAKRNTEETITALRTALAEPEQEPMALETVYETIINWDESGGKRSRRELAQRIVALYTHPADDTALLRQALEAIEGDLSLFNIPATARMLEAITALRDRLGEKT